MDHHQDIKKNHPKITCITYKNVIILVYMLYDCNFFEKCFFTFVSHISHAKNIQSQYFDYVILLYNILIYIVIYYMSFK